MEELYVAEMDGETVTQDFDDVDLYGTKMVEDDDDNCTFNLNSLATFPYKNHCSEVTVDKCDTG